VRTKSDSRRDAILEAATGVFREVGYERASMNEISARAGGSKATLYSYFPSKEELFAAAMMAAVEEQGERAFARLDPARDDVERTLVGFGEAYLAMLTTADALAITRTAIADGAQTALGTALYAKGPERSLEDLARYFDALQQQGRLAPDADPRVMAAQFRALVRAGTVEPLLYGAGPRFRVAEMVQAGVGAFLRAYAPKPDAHPHKPPPRTPAA